MNLGIVETWAERPSREAIVIAETHGWEPDAFIAPALATLGVSAMQSGRLDEADGWLDRANLALRTRTRRRVCLSTFCAGSCSMRGRAEGGIASLLGAE